MSASEEQAASKLLSDADVVARIATGDLSAETVFVRKYERGVRVLVRRHCRANDPMADDLAQDVLMKVLERLRAGAIRDSAALPAYIQSTVVYTTSAEYRARRPTESAAVLETIASEENPADRLSSVQLSRMLKNLLAQLPVGRDREILVRFYLDEEDKDDVCERLGIDTSHFHKVIFRARARLRELLQEAGIEGMR